MINTYSKASLTMTLYDYTSLFGSIGSNNLSKPSKVVYKRAFNQEEVKTLFTGTKQVFVAALWYKRNLMKSRQVGTAALEMIGLAVTFSANTSVAKIEVGMSQMGEEMESD